VRFRPGFAAAKINLFLHVGPPTPDGYHPICSLMTFADVGDELAVRTSDESGFSIDGPFASELQGETRNLVTQASKALRALSGATAPPPVALRLTKILPIAAGLGGGSADGAAALRLLCPIFGVDLDDRRLIELARDLGSDVSACLRSRMTLAKGRGDDLSPAPRMPALHAVLVNPRIASPTGEVYRAYDDAPAPEGANEPDAPAEITSVRGAVAYLAACRNDLEAPAVRLRPRIGDVLARLAVQPETLMARMSGSGATCFALCEDEAAAAALAGRLAADESGWWIRRTLLSGSEDG
jgi:4-diphosphocytidyl-2-C-methyl-D-erythritol kinase